MVLLGLLLCFLTTADSESESRIWMPVGSPIIGTCPCKNTHDIAVWLEPGLPLRYNNRYYVYINRFFPADSVIKVSFDSEVNIAFTVRSDAGNFSRISLSDGDIFALRFFAPQESLGLAVTWRIPGITPNLIGFTIDDVEYCTQPDVGFLRKYAENENAPTEREYQWQVESRRSKKSELIHNCGRRSVESEVVVDGAAEPDAWPWFAAIHRIHRIHRREAGGLRYLCAGTLVSRNTVLTAGHCTTRTKPENLIVSVGRYAVQNGAEGYIARKVARILTPQNDGAPNATWLSNNIALLKLEEGVPVTDGIYPACLWHGAVRGLPDNLTGTIVGWGYDANGEPNLQQASLPLVGRSTCVESDPRLVPALNDNTFCAGFHLNGTSACNGDGGVAFLVFIPDSMPEGCLKGSKASGSWHVRGILSMYAGYSSDDATSTCGQSYLVFTDVDKFRDWIYSHLGD